MPFLQGFCRCSLCLVQLHSAFSHAVPLELRRSPSFSPSRRGTPLPGLLAHVGPQLASLPIASSSSAPCGRPPTEVGSLPTPAKQELAPRQLSPPCCGLSMFGGDCWHASAKAVAQISAACNTTWPPAARLTRRMAPCSACSSWPRKHSARRASPPCNETSLCRSLCKKNGPRLCTACFFMASGRSRLFSHAKITLASAFSSFPFSCCPLHVAPPSSGPNPAFRAENLDLGHFRRVSSSPFLSGPVRACLCRRFACSSLRLAQERLLHSLRTHSKSRF